MRAQASDMVGIPVIIMWGGVISICNSITYKSLSFGTASRPLTMSYFKLSMFNF